LNETAVKIGLGGSPDSVSGGAGVLGLSAADNADAGVIPELVPIFAMLVGVARRLQTKTAPCATNTESGMTNERQINAQHTHCTTRQA
jgi:hypothetical protein